MLLTCFSGGEVAKGAVCAANRIGGHYHVVVPSKDDQFIHINYVSGVDGREERQVSGVSCAENVIDGGQISLIFSEQDGVILGIVGNETDCEINYCSYWKYSHCP